MKQKLVFISVVVFTLVIIFLNATAPTSNAAPIECKGVVSDENGKPLDDVQLKIYDGKTPPTIQEKRTAGGGKYGFVTIGFGAGIAPTNKMEFSKENYKTAVYQFYNSAANDFFNSCPGNVKLPSAGISGGLACLQGECVTYDATKASLYSKTYNESSACFADCGKFRLDASRGCLPDPTNPTHFSKSDCDTDFAKAQVPTGQVQKYKYSPGANACVPVPANDPEGVTLEECRKKEKVTFNTITPNPPPCSQWATWDGTPIPTTSKLFENKDSKIRCISVQTGIGPLSTDVAGFVQRLFAILLSVSGGIATIIFIIAGYKYMTSQGDPEALKAAQEQMTSAVVGLLFLVFSVLLLEVIGVDILHLPGLTK